MIFSPVMPRQLAFMLISMAGWARMAGVHLIVMDLGHEGAVDEAGFLKDLVAGHGWVFGAECVADGVVLVGEQRLQDLHAGPPVVFEAREDVAALVAWEEGLVSVGVEGRACRPGVRFVGFVLLLRWIRRSVSRPTMPCSCCGSQGISRRWVRGWRQAWYGGCASFLAARGVLQSGWGSPMSHHSKNVMIMHLFRQYRQDHQQGAPLADLLLQSADFECSDSRDGVYGLLGLSTASARGTIDRSITPEQARAMFT